MNRSDAAPRMSRHPWLALALLVMLALVGVTGAATRAHASSCLFARGETLIYYSNASHSQVIGSCGIIAECGVQPGCTGQKSKFASLRITGICEICTP